MHYFKLHKYQFSNGGKTVVKSGHDFKAMKAEAVKDIKATPDSIKSKQISTKKVYFKPFNK